MPIFNTQNSNLNQISRVEPKAIERRPKIDISGSLGHRIMTIRITSFVMYQDGPQVRKRLLHKDYKLDEANPNEIELKLFESQTTQNVNFDPQLSNDDNIYNLENDAQLSSPNEIFKLIVDPTKRTGDINFPNPRNAGGTIYNPAPLKGNSYQMPNPPSTLNEAYLQNLKQNGIYEAYKLPIVNQFNTNSNSELKSLLYIKRGSPVSILGQINNYPAEFTINGIWENITVKSLLCNLFEKVPYYYVNLMIVGNHKIIDINTGLPKYEDVVNDDKVVIDAEIPTPPPLDLDYFKWTRFCEKRAYSLGHYIFGNKVREITPREDDILLSGYYNVQLCAAQRIEFIGTIPYSATTKQFAIFDQFNNHLRGSDQVLVQYRNNALYRRYQTILQLDKYKLRRGIFGAGATFIWSFLNIAISNILFLSDEVDISPTAGTIQANNVVTNNAIMFTRIRQILLGSGSVITSGIGTIQIKLWGYTDAVGDTAYNMQLSYNRVMSVYNELITPTKFLGDGLGGIPPSQIIIPTLSDGLGEQFLLIDTQGPNQINRRVEIQIVAY